MTLRTFSLLPLRRILAAAFLLAACGTVAQAQPVSGPAAPSSGSHATPAPAAPLARSYGVMPALQARFETRGPTARLRAPSEAAAREREVPGGREGFVAGMSRRTTYYVVGGALAAGLVTTAAVLLIGDDDGGDGAGGPVLAAPPTRPN